MGEAAPGCKAPKQGAYLEEQDPLSIWYLAQEYLSSASTVCWHISYYQHSFHLLPDVGTEPKSSAP